MIWVILYLGVAAAIPIFIDYAQGARITVGSALFYVFFGWLGTPFGLLILGLCAVVAGFETVWPYLKRLLDTVLVEEKPL